MIYILLSLIAIYFLFFHKSRDARLLEAFEIPRDVHYPIVGIIPFFMRAKREEILPALCSWADRIGPVFRLTSVYASALTISEAKTAEKLFNSSRNITKGFDYDVIRPWLGDGLLMSTGQKWGHRRKLLTPAFHFRILEDFMQVFNAESKKLVEILRKECVRQKSFDIYGFVSRCALDIICETAMGTSVKAQDTRDSEYINAINEFGLLAQARAFRPWLRFEPLFKLTSNYRQQEKVLKILHGFTNQVISERKKMFLENKGKTQPDPKEEENEDESSAFYKKKKRLAFLDLLLEAQAASVTGQGQSQGHGESPLTSLTDEDLREETDTFMFEGHDTTSTGVAFTLYALGLYPEIQEKVRQEIDQIFGPFLEKEKELTTEDLSKMKYLECVIKETLRLFPSVPFIQRKLDEDLKLRDERIIPKGTTVGIFLYKIHRDPEAFPDPESFKPERFLEKGHDPYAFVPFSAGARNCIGQRFAMMEEKVMISTILRHFVIKSVIPREKLRLISEMILRSEDGIPLELTPRAV